MSILAEKVKHNGRFMLIIIVGMSISIIIAMVVLYKKIVNQNNCYQNLPSKLSN